MVLIVAIGVPKTAQRGKNPAKQFSGRDKIRLGLQLGELSHRSAAEHARFKRGCDCERISDGYTFRPGGDANMGLRIPRKLPNWQEVVTIRCEVIYVSVSQ